MSKELEPLNADREMDNLTANVAMYPDGSYHIPGVKFSYQTPEVAKLHAMMSMLSMRFPEYIWETSDSLFPQDLGITVRWRRKREVKHGDGTKRSLGQ